MRRKTFAEIRRKAPPIFVSRGKETSILFPQERDVQYDEHPYSRYFIEGTGSLRFPYTYVSAADASAHYAVVDLWFRFRKRKRPVFIEVNDWVLRVEQASGRAMNNTFTRLLPLSGSERRA